MSVSFTISYKTSTCLEPLRISYSPIGVCNILGGGTTPSSTPPCVPDPDHPGWYIRTGCSQSQDINRLGRAYFGPQMQIQYMPKPGSQCDNANRLPLPWSFHYPVNTCVKNIDSNRNFFYQGQNLTFKSEMVIMKHVFDTVSVSFFVDEECKTPHIGQAVLGKETTITTIATATSDNNDSCFSMQLINHRGWSQEIQYHGPSCTIPVQVRVQRSNGECTQQVSCPPSQGPGTFTRCLASNETTEESVLTEVQNLFGGASYFQISSGDCNVETRTFVRPGYCIATQGKSAAIMYRETSGGLESLSFATSATCLGGSTAKVWSLGLNSSRTGDQHCGTSDGVLAGVYSSSNGISALLIGLIVGGCVGLVVLILIGIWLFRLKKNSSKKPQNEELTTFVASQ